MIVLANAGDLWRNAPADLLDALVRDVLSEAQHEYSQHANKRHNYLHVHSTPMATQRAELSAHDHACTAA